MQILVCQGDGKYYVSTVFGYYHNIRSEDEHQRMTEAWYTPYYVVWDEKKEKLIRWFNMKQVSPHLIQQALVVDSDQSDWVMDEKGYGGPAFLPRPVADDAWQRGVLSDALREACLAYDGGRSYDPYPEIRTEKDIRDFEWALGGLHDAYIVKLETREDGLYLLFDGVWGCKAEIWFWGDVTYRLTYRAPDGEDPYWYDSGVALRDGFVYLIDDGAAVEQIGEEYDFFKARHMKYHIIPD